MITQFDNWEVRLCRMCGCWEHQFHLGVLLWCGGCRCEARGCPSSRILGGNRHLLLLRKSREDMGFVWGGKECDKVESKDSLCSETGLDSGSTWLLPLNACLILGTAFNFCLNSFCRVLITEFFYSLLVIPL